MTDHLNILDLEGPEGQYCPLYSLPPEMKLQIFTENSPKSKLNLARTCSDFNFCDKMWKAFQEEDFHEQNLLGFDTWKYSYTLLTYFKNVFEWLQTNGCTTAIYLLPEIYHLKLPRKYLYVIPHEFGNLVTLRRIDFSFNNLKELPAEFKKLKNLRIINFQGNRFTEIPDEITCHDKVEELYFGMKTLTAIPDSISDMSSLRVLDLYDSNIQNISEQIGTLQELEKLVLVSCHLETLPTQIGMLSKLKILDIADNNLSKLPNEIMNLKNLSSFILTRNQFTEIPDDIGNLQNLSYFEVIQCKCKTILPESCLKLTNCSIMVDTTVTIESDELNEFVYHDEQCML